MLKDPRHNKRKRLLYLKTTSRINVQTKKRNHVDKYQHTRTAELQVTELGKHDLVQWQNIFNGTM